MKSRVFAAFLDGELTETGAKDILGEDEFSQAIEWMEVADIIEPLEPDVDKYLHREGDSDE